MKKHLFAIAVYTFTFCVSVLLVGLLTERAAPTVFTPLLENRVSYIPTAETSEQTDIRVLLILDEQYGLQYQTGPEDADRAAVLIERMRSLDNAAFPTPLRKAYQAHTEAWNNYAKHLRNTPNHEADDRDCRLLTREINETYNTVLLSAKSYGVDFED